MKRDYSLLLLLSLLTSTAQGLVLENYDAALQSSNSKNNSLPFSQNQTQQHFKTLQNKTIPIHIDKHNKQNTFIWASEQLAVPSVSSSQTLTTAQTKLSKVQTSESIAREYLQMFYPQEKPSIQSKTSAPQRQAVLQNIHNTGKGPIIVRFKQSVDGTEVFARNVNVLMKQDYKLVAVSGFFTHAKPDNTTNSTSVTAASISQLSAGDAIAFAYHDMGVSVYISELQPLRKVAGPYTNFNASVQEGDYKVAHNPRAKQVWYELDNRLIPAFYVEVSLQENNSNDSYNYSYVISALDKQVLFRKNLTEEENFTYRTFTDPDSLLPLRGPMGNIYPLIGLTPQQAQQQVSLDYDSALHQLITLKHGPINTGDSWLPIGATETHGNNVDAYVDINPGDGLTAGDFRAETTAFNTFDWAFDPEHPDSLSSRKAAIVNLFYVNNWLHDYFYNHGFTETDGNAQMHNYARGGIEGDELRAEGQDFSGRSNANMSTPADGAHPRMQMYNFNGFETRGETFNAQINSPAGLTLIAVQPASFGAKAFPRLTAEVVRLEDALAPINDGCQAAVNPNALLGNIAIIDRGACSFALKVKNAQNAGAIAALVANNRDASVPAPMGGGDSSVLIPSFGLAQNDGSTIYAELDANRPVVLSMYRDFVPDRDGTLANGIVAHEWGHYISNRLVQDASGLVNNQGRSMGEGWSDFIAIFLAIKESHRNIPGNERYQGQYSSGGWVDPDPYFGIRRVPYSTDTSINATSFKHIDDAVPFTFAHPIAFSGRNSEVHASGEIWATMLLEAYVALLNDTTRLSFTQAQSRMADYLVAGLKMLPFAPTFVEGRDGLLAAAYARDKDDYWLILNAFAKRGLGMGAIAPARMNTSHAGVVESFASTVASFELISTELDVNLAGQVCSADNVLDVGETALLRVSIRNNGNQNLRDINAVLSSNADLDFNNDGKVTFKRVDYLSGIHTADITFELESAKFAEEITLQLDFLPNKHDPAVVTPKTETITFTVNYNFTPDQRLSDNNENTLTSPHDWTTQVDLEPKFFTGDAKETFALDGGRFNEQFGSGQMWLGRNNFYQSDVSLLTPVVEVGSSGAFTFSFDHAHWFELGNWDGGVVEIKIGNGKWQDVLDAGGVFQGYAYNGRLRVNASQPLSGQSAFVNANSSLNHTTVDFGTALNGQHVQLRFRIGTDSNTGGQGWVIDNMTFNNIVNQPFSMIEPNADEFCDK